MASVDLGIHASGNLPGHATVLVTPILARLHDRTVNMYNIGYTRDNVKVSFENRHTALAKRLYRISEDDRYFFER